MNVVEGVPVLTWGCLTPKNLTVFYWGTLEILKDWPEGFYSKWFAFGLPIFFSYNVKFWTLFDTKPSLVRQLYVGRLIIELIAACHKMLFLCLALVNKIQES